jgi:hypothetical protein
VNVCWTMIHLISTDEFFVVIIVFYPKKIFDKLLLFYLFLFTSIRTNSLVLSPEDLVCYFFLLLFLLVLNSQALFDVIFLRECSVCA